MKVKVGIPIQDLDGMEFDYGKELSNEEYAEMLNDVVINNYQDVNKYDRYVKNGNDKMVSVELDAILLDSDKLDNISKEFLDETSNSGGMSILVLNVCPNNPFNDETEFDDSTNFMLLEDAETEIKYWVNDSMLIWNNSKLDDEEKLLNSPERDLYIVIDGGEKYYLKNCKVFEEYKTNNYPLYFAVIVGKISK